MHTVLIKADDDGRILAVDSDEFLTDTTGWRPVDSGSGDRYHHAQGNYLPGDVYREGICCWMTAPVGQEPKRQPYREYEYEGQAWGIYRRTEAEMEADRMAAMELSASGENETEQRIRQLEKQIAQQARMLDKLSKEQEV